MDNRYTYIYIYIYKVNTQIHMYNQFHTLNSRPNSREIFTLYGRV